MKVYEINPNNFGEYKNKLRGLLKKPNMCGVFSKSCGHCETMKPEWEKLKTKIAGSPGNGSLIEIDSEVVPRIEHKPLREKIVGYPTILIIKQGIPKMEYTGNRTFEDMYEYFKKNVPQHSSIATISTNHGGKISPKYRKSGKGKKNKKSILLSLMGGSKKKKQKRKCCSKKNRPPNCICGSRCNPRCYCCNSRKSRKNKRKN